MKRVGLAQLDEQLHILGASKKTHTVRVLLWSISHPCCPTSLAHPRHQVGSVDILLETSYDKLDTGAASAASDEVECKFTITNNGLLRLYDIGVEDEGLQARGVTIVCTDADLQTATGAGHGLFAGLAAYPGNGLAPAASLTCTANDGVSQAEVSQSAAPRWCNSGRGKSEHSSRVCSI